MAPKKPEEKKVKKPAMGGVEKKKPQSAEKKEKKSVEKKQKKDDAPKDKKRKREIQDEDEEDEEDQVLDHEVGEELQFELPDSEVSVEVRERRRKFLTSVGRNPDLMPLFGKLTSLDPLVRAKTAFGIIQLLHKLQADYKVRFPPFVTISHASLRSPRISFSFWNLCEICRRESLPSRRTRPSWRRTPRLIPPCALSSITP